METITWMDNQALMAELWPKWKLEPALASVIHEKWSRLHQDKLRDCIRQHRMERDTKPDISAIHAAYCAITPDHTGRREVLRTKKEAERVTGPTDAEIEAWEYWAREILATATPAEIAAAKERVGLVSLEKPRILAVAIDWCSKNPAKR